MEIRPPGPPQFPSMAPLQDPLAAQLWGLIEEFRDLIGGNQLPDPTKLLQLVDKIETFVKDHKAEIEALCAKNKWNPNAPVQNYMYAITDVLQEIDNCKEGLQQGKEGFGNLNMINESMTTLYTFMSEKAH